MSTFEDDFNRADANLAASANWEDNAAFADHVDIVGNAVVPSGSTQTAAKWVGGGSWGQRQKCEVAIGSNYSGNAVAGPAVFMGSDGFWFVGIFRSYDELRLYRYENDAGTNTRPTQATGITTAPGDVVSYEIEFNSSTEEFTHTVQLNGVTVLTRGPTSEPAIDGAVGERTPVTSGNPGVVLHSSAELDDWGAEDFAVGTDVGRAGVLATARPVTPSFGSGAVVRDDFTYADGDLSAQSDWAHVAASNDELQVASNELVGEAADTHVVRWVGSGTWGSHQRCRFTLTNSPTSDDWGPAVLCTDATVPRFYMAQVSWNTNELRITRHDDGSFDQLTTVSFASSNLGRAPAASDTIEIEVEDDGSGNPSLTFRANGVDELTHVDNSAGKLSFDGTPGVFVFGTGITIDDFEAENFTGSGAVVRHVDRPAATVTARPAAFDLGSDIDLAITTVTARPATAHRTTTIGRAEDEDYSIGAFTVAKRRAVERADASATARGVTAIAPIIHAGQAIVSATARALQRTLVGRAGARVHAREVAVAKSVRVGRGTVSATARRGNSPQGLTIEQVEVSTTARRVQILVGGFMVVSPARVSVAATGVSVSRRPTGLGRAQATVTARGVSPVLLSSVWTEQDEATTQWGTL